VLFAKKHKPRERYYLLPGQGGKNFHQKQHRFILWATAVAIVFGTVIGAIMWWMARAKTY
jgi:hypothetical protein